MSETAFPIISVVVPVFNVVRYLEECVESILHQSYPNIEIILVDDGSSDGSEAMVDYYASQFPNIIAVHQKNAGVGAARNTGIRHASGKYIAFIDSDDYISPVFLEVLYQAIANENVAMATVRHGESFYEKRPFLIDSFEKASSYSVLTELEYQEELLYQKSWNGSVWRLCDRDILDGNTFTEEYVFEDLESTYRLVKKAGSIAVLDSTNLYAYRQRNDGIMRRSQKDDQQAKKDSGVKTKVESGIAITKQLYEDINNWYPQLSNAVASRCFAVNRVVFSQLSSNNTSDIKNVWRQLKKYRSTVLNDPAARKKERFAAMIACCGKMPFQLFCKIYRVVLRHQ